MRNASLNRNPFVQDAFEEVAEMKKTKKKCKFVSRIYGGKFYCSSYTYINIRTCIRRVLSLLHRSVWLIEKYCIVFSHSEENAYVTAAYPARIPRRCFKIKLVSEQKRKKTLRTRNSLTIRIHEIKNKITTTTRKFVVAFPHPVFNNKRDVIISYLVFLSHSARQIIMRKSTEKSRTNIRRRESIRIYTLCRHEW